MPDLVHGGVLVLETELLHCVDVSQLTHGDAKSELLHDGGVLELVHGGAESDPLGAVQKLRHRKWGGAGVPQPDDR